MHNNKISQSLVSVIIATYNVEKTLQDCLDSVQGQTYRNLEIIVIDGGSTDRTLNIIQKNLPIIGSWVSEPDAGIYAAWNKGLAMANGDWIGFLGADDRYHPDALERYMQAMHNHPEHAFEYISSKVEFTLPGLHRSRVIGSAWNWAAFRKYMNVAHVGSLHHRLLYERYGNYDNSYALCGDYELLLRPGRDLKAGFVDAVTATMRGGGMSNSGYRVFDESMRAKATSGGRHWILCFIEKYTAIARHVVRTTLYRIVSLYDR